MTRALEELAGLVQTPRPAGLFIPEPLYTRVRSELSRLVEFGREALPFAMDRLVDQATACQSIVRQEMTGAEMSSLRMRLTDTLRTAARCGVQ